MYDPPNFTASPLKCSFISVLASLTDAHMLHWQDADVSSCSCRRMEMKEPELQRGDMESLHGACRALKPAAHPDLWGPHTEPTCCRRNHLTSECQQRASSSGFRHTYCCSHSSWHRKSLGG